MAEDPRTSNPERSGYGAYGSAGEGAATPSGLKRISWGAIIAGTVVALVVYLMLGLLGIGIGATTIELTAAQAVPEGLGIGAGVWWVLTVLIALFIGGWLAGYLAGIPEKRDGAIHGIVTWGLVILLSAWFTTTAVGTVTAGAFNVLEGGMAMLGEQEMPGEVVEQIDDPELQQQVEEAIAAAQQEFEAVADDVTEAVAQAGIWGFIGLLLAAVVAGLGGVLGAAQTARRAYVAPPGAERREERLPERERERAYGRHFDYERERAERDRAERERAERERAERERAEREGVAGREMPEREREREREREAGEREREQQRERLERERAERERAERERYDQP